MKAQKMNVTATSVPTAKEDVVNHPNHYAPRRRARGLPRGVAVRRDMLGPVKQMRRFKEIKMKAASMTQLVVLPCPAQMLECVLHAACDQGRWHDTVKVVRDDASGRYLLVLEDETGE